MPALLMHLMMTLLLWEVTLPLGDFLLGSDWMTYSTTGDLDSQEQGWEGALRELRNASSSCHIFLSSW